MIAFEEIAADKIQVRHLDPSELAGAGEGDEAADGRLAAQALFVFIDDGVGGEGDEADAARAEFAVDEDAPGVVARAGRGGRAGRRLLRRCAGGERAQRDGRGRYAGRQGPGTTLAAGGAHFWKIGRYRLGIWRMMRAMAVP